MKSTEAKLLQALGAVSQFIIPMDQRTTSWTLKECQQLWADILRAGASKEMGLDTSVSPPFTKEIKHKAHTNMTIS